MAIDVVPPPSGIAADPLIGRAMDQYDVQRVRNREGWNSLRESNNLRNHISLWKHILYAPFHPMNIDLVLFAVIALFFCEFEILLFILTSILLCSLLNIIGARMCHQVETNSNNTFRQVEAGALQINTIRFDINRRGNMEDTTTRGKDLIVGDLIRLMPGNLVPADVRIFIATKLEVMCVTYKFNENTGAIFRELGQLGTTQDRNVTDISWIEEDLEGKGTVNPLIKLFRRILGKNVNPTDDQSQAAIEMEERPRPGNSQSGPIESNDNDDDIMVTLGSAVVSGTAVCKVVATGERTQLGRAISQHRTDKVTDKTDKGFLHQANVAIGLIFVLMLVALLIVQTTVGLKMGTWAEAALFMIPFGVAITPKFLPSMVSMGLAKAALKIRRRCKSVVRELDTIVDLAGVDTLLIGGTTGVLTTNSLVLRQPVNIQGHSSNAPLFLGFLNAHFQSAKVNMNFHSEIEKYYERTFPKPKPPQRSLQVRPEVPASEPPRPQPQQEVEPQSLRPTEPEPPEPLPRPGTSAQAVAVAEAEAPPPEPQPRPGTSAQEVAVAEAETTPPEPQPRPGTSAQARAEAESRTPAKPEPQPGTSKQARRHVKPPVRIPIPPKTKKKPPAPPPAPTPNPTPAPNYVNTSNFDITEDVELVYENPFDFNRRCCSVIVKMKDTDADYLLVCSGAVGDVLLKCTDVLSSQDPIHGRQNLLQNFIYVFLQDGTLATRAKKDEDLRYYKDLHEAYSNEGRKVVCVAYKRISRYTDEGRRRKQFGLEDESRLTLAGFLVFEETTRHETIPQINFLQTHGVQVKLLTGESPLYAKYLFRELKVPDTNVTMGVDISRSGIPIETVARRATEHNVFAKVTPVQKNEILKGLQQVKDKQVAYLGKCTSDLNAMTDAHVAITHNEAPPSCLNFADMVVPKDRILRSVAASVIMSRIAYLNTLKFAILSLGYMVGLCLTFFMTSVWLNFDPVTGLQLVFHCLCCELLHLSLFFDNVEKEDQRSPHRFNVTVALRFIVILGLSSALFSLGIYLFMICYFKIGAVHRTEEHFIQFRSAWFTGSLLYQALIPHIVRTWKISFIQSFASGLVIIASVLLAHVAVSVPIIPGWNEWMGLKMLPLEAYAFIGAGLTGLFVFAQIMKVNVRFLDKQRARQSRVIRVIE